MESMTACTALLLTALLLCLPRHWCPQLSGLVVMYMVDPIDEYALQHFIGTAAMISSAGPDLQPSGAPETAHLWHTQYAISWMALVRHHGHMLSDGSDGSDLHGLVPCPKLS